MHTVTALMLMAFIASTEFGSALSLSAADCNWDLLNVLKPRQEIRVELNDSSSLRGTFSARTQEGITLQQPSGQQTLARGEVLRVYSRSKHARLYNMAVGAGIGAAVGIVGTVANREADPHGVEPTWWIFPAAMVLGAAVGAAMPAHGWHLVYRAPRHR